MTSKSLKLKMTLAVSLLVSVILILLGGITNHFWRSELQKTISTQQDALVSALARQLDDKLLSAQEQLMHFSRRIERNVMENPLRFHAIMKEEDDVSVLFGGGLLLISTTGKVIGEYPYSLGHIGSDRSDREYFKQTIATGKPVISSPYISASLKKATIAFTVPIFDENRGMTAILVGRHGLDSSLIFSSLRDLKIGNSGYLYIIDEDRDMVLHPDPKRIMEVLPAGLNTGLDRALNGFEGTIENVNSKGIKGLTSFKHLKSTSWVLAANTPLAEAYAPLHRAKLYALLILAGGILLSIIISRYVMARLTAPLLDLTRHVREFPAKRGKERLFSLSCSDEIGQFGAAFNGLVTQLDEQNATIREAADMYRVVAEFNTELAFWRSEHDTIRYVSPNCRVITGHTDSEFYDSPELMDALIHPDDQQLWSDYRRNAEQGRPCSSLELRIVSKDGTVKWLSHICHKVYGEQGESQGTRGSFIDITLIKQMQQAMEDEKRFFGSLIQNAAAPMFVIDHTHTIIFWNNAIAKLTGRSSFQMVGTKRHWEPFYPSRRPVLADLVLDQKLQSISDYYDDSHSSFFLDGAYRAEGWYDNLGGERRYLFFEAAPILNSRNETVASVETLQDITHRKLAQEAMNRHNLFLQEILDAIPSPVFYKDTQGAYIGCNKAFLAFLGRTPEELVGKTVFDVLPEEQAAENYAQDRRIIREQGSSSYESYSRRCDGVNRLVLQTKATFSRPDGSVGGVVGTFVDITEQRLMDEQIQKMSHALEQSPVTIVITDTLGRIEYVNPKFCQVTGYTPEEAIGQNPRILSSGESTPEEYAGMWHTIVSGHEWRGEFHNRRKNGELYWEFASITPLADKNDKITGYLAVKEDITARKEAEEALALSRQELMVKHQELEDVFGQVDLAKKEWEDTLDCLKDFVILTDAEHHVRRCNRLLCDMTGKNFNEVIDRDWRDLLSEADFTFTTFDGKHGELIHNGSHRLYDLNIYTIEDSLSERTGGLVVSLNDTTEIRSVTEELQRTSKELNETQNRAFQQEKMASIGQLAAGVAHEINNPMGFISSNLSTLNKYLERLKEFIAAQDQVVSAVNDNNVDICELRRKLKINHILDDTKNLIGESQDGVNRVRRIVQDLKSFSRVDQAECSFVDINECLESTINVAWNEIKYIAVLKRDFGTIPQIKCFPQQLNQVFLNLLVNAGQAMQEQGEITVRTWAEQDSMFVSVKDTGTGMPPEVAKRIFEPFFTTKDVGEGTGLGLSISYDIIRKHNGEISVESEPGVGTTFTVRLPIVHL
jgi:PAS domain S-box-containing protein